MAFSWIDTGSGRSTTFDLRSLICSSLRGGAYPNGDAPSGIADGYFAVHPHLRSPLRPTVAVAADRDTSRAELPGRLVLQHGVALSYGASAAIGRTLLFNNALVGSCNLWLMPLR